MGKKIIGVVLLLLTLSAIVFVFYLAGGTGALVSLGIVTGIAALLWISICLLIDD